MRGVGDGREGDGLVSGTMADGCQGLAPSDDSGANAQRAGAVVRHFAAGTGLDSSRDGGGAGTGPTHNWPVGRRLRRGRAWSLDIRAVRRVPPALGETQQAELKAAVQELPEQGGHRTGQLVLEGGAAVRFGTVWRQFEPQQLPELSAPLGICLQAPQEAPAQGG